MSKPRSFLKVFTETGPLVVLAVALGVLPTLILPWMEPHVTGLVDSLMQAKM